MKKKWPFLFVFVILCSALLCGAFSVTLGNDVNQHQLIPLNGGGGSSSSSFIDESNPSGGASTSPSGNWSDYYGYPSSDDYYAHVHISTPEELAYYTKNSIANCDVYLDADLDMSAHYWDGVLYMHSSTFHGQGHEIYGLHIKATTQDMEDRWNARSLQELSYNGYGLFRVIGVNSKIEKLGVGVEIISQVSSTYNNSHNPYIGGIVGKTRGNNIEISDCYAFGSITIADYSTASQIGGIVGNAGSSASSGSYNGTCEVNSCASYVEIDATRGTKWTGSGTGRTYPYCGGIVGLAASTGKTTISSCMNMASKIAGPSGGWVGGIVGNVGGLSIKNCINYSKFEGSANYGGILGYTRSGVQIPIENCGSYHNNIFSKTNWRSIEDYSQDQIDDSSFSWDGLAEESMTQTCIVKKRYFSNLMDSLTWVPRDILKESTFHIMGNGIDNSIKLKNTATGAESSSEVAYYFLYGENYFPNEIILYNPLSKFFSFDKIEQNKGGFTYYTSTNKFACSEKMSDSVSSHVYLYMKKQTIQFSVNCGNCRVNGSASRDASYGDTFAFNLTASDHYKFTEKSRTGDSCIDFDINTGVLTVSNWDGNVTNVEINAYPIIYTAQVSVNAGGNENYSSTQTFSVENYSLTFNLLMNKQNYFDPGYTYSSVAGATVNEVYDDNTGKLSGLNVEIPLDLSSKLGSDYSETFELGKTARKLTKININQTINTESTSEYSAFESLKITTSDGEYTYGSLGDEQGISVSTGSTFEVECTPKAGFKFVGLTLGNKEVGGSTIYEEYEENGRKINVFSKNGNEAMSLQLNLGKQTFTLETDGLTITKGGVGGAGDKKVYYHSVIEVETTNKNKKNFKGIFLNGKLLTMEESYSFIVDPAVVNVTSLSLKAEYLDEMSDASAEEPTKDGKHYTISSVGNLIWLSNQVNGGNDFAGCEFVQTADINFGDAYFNSIGDETYMFSGIYDGQNHTISHLKLTTSSTTAQAGYVGLFGNVENATIKNLVVSNLNVEGYRYVGLIAGKATNSTFYNVVAENCKVTINNIPQIYDIAGNAVSGDSITYTDSIVIVNGSNLPTTCVLMTQTRECFAAAVGSASGCTFTGVGINAEIENSGNILTKAFNGSGESTYSQCFVEGDELQEVSGFGEGTASDCYYREAESQTEQGTQTHSWYSGEHDPAKNTNYIKLNGKDVLRFFYWAA